ncbi:MAG TPA: efflux RND transporter permease subunit, partial [Rhodospirillales bacterium]|nr:efflux RND transporter permease subunit [Rhodospirillales bacterium]
MNLIRLSIERPIAVIAAVIMTVMFGLVALQTIPIQLTPDVRKPVITIKTDWPGAAPAEVEREIVNRQEDMLRGLEGLEKITSRSETGRGDITLEFSASQNMDKALLLVSNRLDRVNGYPFEADEPVLDTSGSEDKPIAWLVLTRTQGNDRNIYSYGDFVEDVIKDRLERVPGVSRSNVFGGSKRRMEVVVDPARMARYRLTVPDILDTLRAANSSLSAGGVEEGKRRYVVRTEGEFTTLEQVRAVVLRSLENPRTGGVARVTVGDIADVRFGYEDPTARIRVLGKPAIAMNTVRETGANVIETMKGIHAAVKELNAKVLPAQGLKLKQVYDETVYINSAINLVQQNIWVGGALAALILFLFLRSGSATLIVSLSIPVSVVGSFVAMALMGRSINVISLAGIAFAVG